MNRLNPARPGLVLLVLLIVIAYVASYLALVEHGRKGWWPGAVDFKYSDNMAVNRLAYWFFYPCYAADGRFRRVICYTHEPLRSLRETMTDEELAIALNSSDVDVEASE